MSEQDILVIRTEVCKKCLRFDSIMILREEVEEKTKETGTGIHTVLHKDHTREIQFNEKGEYLGDQIIETTVRFKLTVNYDPSKTNKTDLEHWIETQLQKMQDTGDGLTGYYVDTL